MFAFGALIAYVLISSGVIMAPYTWIIPLLVLEILFDINLYCFFRSKHEAKLPHVDGD